MLKAGIERANKVTTVSNTYAQEIMNPYYAYGLEHILASRSYKLSGIVNGIDITTNEIQSDEFLEKMMKHIGVNGEFVKMIRTMYKFNFTDNSSLIVTKNREVPVGVKELNYINRHTPIYDNLQKSLFSSETTLDRSNKVWLREMYDGVRLVHCRLIMK